VRFIALLCWVLLLSWLTHVLASPWWRAPNPVAVLLSETEALDTSAWQTLPKSASLSVLDEKALSVTRPPGAWGRALRVIDLPPDTRLIRLEARLGAMSSYRDTVTLFPKPVFHLRVDQGVQRYPLVERPMFFQRVHKIDELVTLPMGNEILELGLLAPPNLEWRVSGLTVTSVTEHRRYAQSFSAVIALWGLTVLWVVVKAWRRSRVPTALIGVVIAGVLVGVLSSRSQVVSAFHLIAKSVASIGGEVTANQFSSFMQAGHVILFAVLTLFALILRQRWLVQTWQVITGIFVLAIATEALQRHALGRSPDIQDLLFDTLGIMAGWMLFSVFRRLRRRSK